MLVGLGGPACVAVCCLHACALPLGILRQEQGVFQCNVFTVLLPPLRFQHVEHVNLAISDRVHFLTTVIFATW